MVLAGALVFSAGGSSGEEELALVFRAPYEVITNDLSCSGPLQALVRTELRVTDYAGITDATQYCPITVRSDRVYVSWIPCDQGIDGFSLPSELEKASISLTANVEVCRSLWHERIDMTFGEISIDLNGRRAIMPLRPGFRYLHLGSMEPGGQAPSEVPLNLDISCELGVGQLDLDKPVEFELAAQFLLSEDLGARCTDASCLQPAKDSPTSSEGIRLHMRCADATAETTP